MKSSFVLFVAASGRGRLVASLDSVLGPSLNLLSINSTGLTALTALSVGIILLLGSRRAPPARAPPKYRVRMPALEMQALVRGAREGYVSNRRGVARVLAGAAKARLDDGRMAPTGPEVEGYLRAALGSSYSGDLFLPQAENRVRVPPSGTYVASLKEAVALLERRLEE